MKSQAAKKHQRHAAVRPDVSPVKTWLATGDVQAWEGDRPGAAAAIVELKPNTYLRLRNDGKWLVYECATSPDDSSLASSHFTLISSPEGA